MNQPTEDRIKRLEEKQKQLEEEILKLKEQRTDEMKAINVNVGSADVVTHLDTLEQKIDTVQDDTNILKIQMQGARGDILQIRESQADLRDRLIAHGEDLKAIQEKQHAHQELLGQLITVGESHTKRFDQVDTSIAELKSAQTEQGKKLDLILNLLQKRE